MKKRSISSAIIQTRLYN